MRNSTEAPVPLKVPVTFRAYAGKQMGKVWFTPVKDSITGKYLGIPEVNPEEQRKLPRQWDPSDSEFGRMVSDGLELNPNSPVDQYDWAWMQYNKEIADNIDEAKANEAQTIFFIDDPGREVRKRKALADTKFKAQSIIRDLQKSEKVDMMRYLGIHASLSMSDVDLDDILVQRAESEPQAIINAYSDPIKKDKLFILALVDAKKLKKDHYGAYRLGDALVGQNLEAAVLWLQDPRNRDIVARLFMELKEKNPALQSISVIEEFEAEAKKEAGALTGEVRA
jgi:hypothetical protein